MRLIDADALNFALCVKCANSESDDTCKVTGCGVVEIVDSMPTIEPEERHGRWVDIGNNAGMRCSECRCKIRYKNGVKDVMSNHIPAGYYRYCPFCGAKTDGDKDEGD